MVKHLDVMSRQETCTYLGVSLSTLERMIRRGHLPIVKLDRRILIRKATLDAWLQSHEQRRAFAAAAGPPRPVLVPDDTEEEA
jgi:excisionase family DNA binding protein